MSSIAYASVDPFVNRRLHPRNGAWANPNWASWHRQVGTPTHELQRQGGWRSSVMVERYAHLASDHLTKAAGRLDSLLDGYDLATLEKEKGPNLRSTP